MVKILLIVPYQGLRDQFEELAATVDDPDILIEMIHIAGTTDEVIRRCCHDVVVARGITYQAIRKAFPSLHLVEIGMTGFDVAYAIVNAIRKFRRPSRIAILMHDLPAANVCHLEELCGIPLEVYDILNEEDIDRAVELARANGADVFIGGLTVCKRCIEQGLNQIHIKTGEESTRLAITEAVKAAKTINLERAKTNLLQAVFDSSDQVLVAVDRKGIITAVNNQAYQTYKISIAQEIVGRSVQELLPDADWRSTLENGTQHEMLHTYEDKSYLMGCKPIVVDQQNVGVLITVQNTERISETESRIRKELGAKGLVAKYHFGDIIGSSAVMKSNIATAYKYSQVDSNVLLIGETGTGKELFAHSIHNASRRSNLPFVAVNCAALPENLLESELFGYAPGAFSGASKTGKTGLFELAHQGTIFLDEIGEMPIALQAKLLRVLQEREIRRVGDDRVIPVDVRVISATNINIDREIAQGHFRADLYYRLNLLNLTIPPLRKRGGDVAEMVSAFISRYACEYNRTAPKLTDEAIKLLCGYEWPGNIRELRNLCERLVVLAESEMVGQAELERIGSFTKAAAPLQTAEAQQPTPAPSEEDLADQQLLALLARPNVKRDELAKLMGVSRTTLWRRLNKLVPRE